MPEKILKYLHIYLTFLKSLRNLSGVDSLQVGSMILNKEGEVLSCGYNHSALFTTDHEHNYELILHAEAQAIANLNTEQKELVMLCSHSPCLGCTALIIASPVKKVFYLEEYKDKTGIDYLNKIGILCQQLTTKTG